MEMLSLALNRTGDTPLYEQLYTYIKAEIIAGRMPYDSKLPSKRKLAQFLKVSLNTVDTAYQQLVAEGYVESLERKGYFVQALMDLEFVADPPQARQNQTEKPKWHYRFHPGWVDTRHFPFAKWRKYAKEVVDIQYEHLLLTGDKRGDLVLRREIAHYLYHARGVHCQADEIIIGAGMEALLQQLIFLFSHETQYGIEDPGYHVMSHILQQFQSELYPLKVDAEGLLVDDLLESPVDVVYVTPSHHFPYGSVMPVNRRNQLLKWAAQKEGRYIIEDDYDSEFRYHGMPIPALQGMDKSDKVIYLGSFSKSLMPSLRVGYMVLPAKLIKAYRQQLSFYQCAVSRIDQHILARFMAEGDFGKHLNRMRKIYAKKLALTQETMRAYRNKIKVIGAKSGLHVVLEVRNGWTEAQLVKAAVDDGLDVYALSRYAISKVGTDPPQIILGFASIPETELAKALDLLMKSWQIPKEAFK